jgi:hypothetical protein
MAGGFIGRAFSPRVPGRAVHGAAPHAGIGRAVGAGGEVEGGRGGLARRPPKETQG